MAREWVPGESTNRGSDLRGQRKEERAAYPRLTLHPDATAMPLDDAFDGG